jgi:hypothetical protein
MKIADKTDAVIELMRESQRDKSSNTAAKRCLRACKILGIEDTVRVFQWIGFCNSNGEPYGKIERIW